MSNNINRWKENNEYEYKYEYDRKNPANFFSASPNLLTVWSAFFYNADLD